MHENDTFHYYESEASKSKRLFSRKSFSFFGNKPGHKRMWVASIVQSKDILGKFKYHQNTKFWKLDLLDIYFHTLMFECHDMINSLRFDFLSFGFKADLLTKGNMLKPCFVPWLYTTRSSEPLFTLLTNIHINLRGYYEYFLNSSCVGNQWFEFLFVFILIVPLSRHRS